MRLIVVGFVNEHALILYVYLSPDEEGGDESVITVSVLCRLESEVLTHATSTTSRLMRLDALMAGNLEMGIGRLMKIQLLERIGVVSGYA